MFDGESALSIKYVFDIFEFRFRLIQGLWPEKPLIIADTNSQEV